jgi:nitroreductase
MEVIEAIRTRRSIRRFKSMMLPEEHLKKILVAAQQAPSAGNRQPWRFIVVTDPNIKDKLGKIARNQTWISKAGVIIVALAMDKKSPQVFEKWAERDVMIAVEHMVLSAWSLGYGSCWIGAFKEKDIKDLLDIPQEMTIINLLPIGVPDENPEKKPRKPFDEIFHKEKYFADT